MLVRYLKKYKLRCFLYLLMTAGSAIAYSRLVMNVSRVFDALMIEDIDTILPLFALLFFGLLAIRLVDFWADVLSIDTLNRIRERMKADLFAGEFRRMDAQALERDSGEYVADYTNDITMIEAKGFQAVKAFASHLVSIITFGGMLYTIDRMMIVPVLISLFFCVLVPQLTKKKTASQMDVFLKQFDRFVQKLDDYFSGFALMKNFGVAAEMEDKFRSDNGETEQRKLEAEYRIETINTLITGVSWVMQIAVVVIGFMAVMEGNLLPGSVIAAYTLTNSLSSPIENIIRSYNEICSVKGIEKKIERAIMAQNEDIDSGGTMRAVESCPLIEMVNVSVVIDGFTVLSDINLTLEAGKRYLLLGNNGSGKTTLMKTLKRIIPISAGQILIERKDIRTFGEDRLNNIISYSNEKVSLFSDTAENNLTFYGDVKGEMIENAAAQAQFMIPLCREIGDAGVRISSGEKRRLEIARSLLYRAPILIFDEVISTLDIKTAYEIERLILSLSNHTVLMVSNAFSGKLLPEYDQIILMDSGKILAKGTHEELLNKCPAYRKLYKIRCG